MKNIRIFLSEIFSFLVVKFSLFLNRCVFVMSFYHYLRRSRLQSDDGSQREPKLSVSENFF